jgi:hypothetical protein
MAKNANQNLANLANFSCDYCQYITNNKFNYKVHLTTRKHTVSVADANKKLINATDDDKILQEQKCFECETCGQKYSHKSSISRHRKSCSKSQGKSSEVVLNSSMQELFMVLLKDNKEFQQLIMEQFTTAMEHNNTMMLECIKECNVGNNNNNNNNNNITNNNTFNMQVFLHEKCADALNIMDFIGQLKLHVSDLEEVGRVGYTEGISKIFIRGLKELDVTQRPIHCSDLKREVMYIKDNGIWEKDNEEKSKMKKAIQHIAQKNIKQMKEWKELNPEHTNPYSNKQEQYMIIMNKSCGGINAEEDEKYWNKIIKNVAKVVIINK